MQTATFSSFMVLALLLGGTLGFVLHLRGRIEKLESQERRSIPHAPDPSAQKIIVARILQDAINLFSPTEEQEQEFLRLLHERLGW